MNGPAHYKEAERLIGIAATLTAETVQHASDNGATSAEMQVMAAHSANLLAEAQVHATLAVAAATVDAAYGSLAITADEAWIEARSDHG